MGRCYTLEGQSLESRAPCVFRAADNTVLQNVQNQQDSAQGKQNRVKVRGAELICSQICPFLLHMYSFCFQMWKQTDRDINYMPVVPGQHLSDPGCLTLG